MWQGGVPGIESVIDHVRREGFPSLARQHYWPWLETREPIPVPERELDRAKLPNGGPLPETWKAWLRFDGAWLKELGWFKSLDPLVFAPRRFSDIVREAVAPTTALILGPLFQMDHFEHCFMLAGGDETRRILVLTDSPDETGEHPVFLADWDDMPSVSARASMCISAGSRDCSRRRSWPRPNPSTRATSTT
jgi:hypothetical protein